MIVLSHAKLRLSDANGASARGRLALSVVVVEDDPLRFESSYARCCAWKWLCSHSQQVRQRRLDFVGLVLVERIREFGLERLVGAPILRVIAESMYLLCVGACSLKTH